jgi:uncharacterized phage-associated protein
MKGEGMPTKSESVAQYILWLARENSITPMQLLKLAYISHGWMLGLYSKPLLDENAEAWQYGPVIPSIYHRYKKFGGSAITEIPQAEPDHLTHEEKDLIRQVWDIYGKYTGLQLSALTHKADTPWGTTRRLVGHGAAISNDLIEDHYRTLATRK